MKIKKRKKAVVERKSSLPISSAFAPKKKANIEFLSTGCTLCDLALSGKGRSGGFARGRMINIVGDGSTGKTLLALETAAWCFYNIKKVRSKIFPPVKHIYIAFNNVEGVMDFPLESLFGPRFARAIEWIRISKVEALGRDIEKRVSHLRRGDFLLYINDSWDGIKPEEESERFKAEAEKNKAISDGYGLSKQQYTHKFCRNIADSIYGEDYMHGYDYKLNQKDVTIIITSQTKQKINATPFEKDVYRTGGSAFNFWTHQVIWLYHAGRDVKERQKKKITRGVKVRAVVERNKVKSPWKEARFPIMFDYGIDNVGSMVDYYFGPQLKSYNASDLGEEEVFGRKDSFIEFIYDNELEDRLKSLVIRKWNEVEDSVKIKRKPKYE